jgi:hypothetical protein
VNSSGVPPGPVTASSVRLWAECRRYDGLHRGEAQRRGTASRPYFADSRLNEQVATPLTANWACTAGTLPGACQQFPMPTEVTDIQFFAQSPAPIDMSAFNYQGYGFGGTLSPYILAKNVSADTVVAALRVPEVPYGSWDEVPSNIGPYGAGGAPTAPVSMGAIAVMQPFDPAVSADSGDFWACIYIDTYDDVVCGCTQSRFAVTVPVIRAAVRQDSDFLAWVILTVSRGHLARGWSSICPIRSSSGHSRHPLVSIVKQVLHYAPIVSVLRA